MSHFNGSKYKNLDETALDFLSKFERFENGERDIDGLPFSVSKPLQSEVDKYNNGQRRDALNFASYEPNTDEDESEEFQSLLAIQLSPNIYSDFSEWELPKLREDVLEEFAVNVFTVGDVAEAIQAKRNDSISKSKKRPNSFIPKKTILRKKRA